MDSLINTEDKTVLEGLYLRYAEEAYSLMHSDQELSDIFDFKALQIKEILEYFQVEPELELELV